MSSPPALRPALLSGLLAVLAGGLAAAPLAAQDSASRVFQHAQAQVTLHLHPGLSDEDRMLLEVLAGSPESLDLLLGQHGGHAAVALAPAEGMVRGGTPTDSASALGGLPDAATARAEALSMCNAARGAGPECVVVLEVAPR